MLNILPIELNKLIFDKLNKIKDKKNLSLLNKYFT